MLARPGHPAQWIGAADRPRPADPAAGAGRRRVAHTARGSTPPSSARSRRRRGRSRSATAARPHSPNWNVGCCRWNPPLVADLSQLWRSGPIWPQPRLSSRIARMRMLRDEVDAQRAGGRREAAGCDAGRCQSLRCSTSRAEKRHNVCDRGRSCHDLASDIADASGGPAGQRAAGDRGLAPSSPTPTRSGRSRNHRADARPPALLLSDLIEAAMFGRAMRRGRRLIRIDVPPDWPVPSGPCRPGWRLRCGVGLLIAFVVMRLLRFPNPC